MADPDGDRPDQGATPLDAYAILDQLCVAIPTTLERQPKLEVGPVLAEVVASRAVGRSFRQEQGVAPCIAWLDRFSRFDYPETGREGLCAVATVMACLVALRLEQEGKDAQLGILRECVERFAGRPMSTHDWSQSCKAGLTRELYRRVSPEQEALVPMAERLAVAQALDDTLLSLLRKGMNGPRHTLAREPEAAVFPELIPALREGRPRRRDLLRGVFDRDGLARPGVGCPFCYRSLTPEQVAELRRKHALAHKSLMCNHLLFYADSNSRLAAGLQELPDA